MISFSVNGRTVEVADDGTSLLEVLRDRLGIRSAKDGCSPQGQCGCCTVLVDGQPRVACVTPARRVRGRSVTTMEGLADAGRWADALAATGGSQCGFCTPGIVMRLSALARPTTEDKVEQSLLAHLCRCTGWQTIVEAALEPESRVLGEGAALRAELEGRSPQRVGPDVAAGAGGFADDTAPLDALVAVPDGRGGWAVGETLSEARASAGKVQGRRTTIPLRHPLDVPTGSWAATLRTTWVEPAYLEPDSSWCEPGGVPVTPLANGGAFGGKTSSVVAEAASRLAAEHGRTVRALLNREDVVRLGPKRPPVAGGAAADGTGVLRIVRTPGVGAAISAVAPGLRIEEVDVAGPPTSVAIRAAGWAEAAVLVAAATGATTVRSSEGAEAEASFGGGDRIRIRVSCGDPLDPVVLRSYCIGAAHMALGWVTSEGIAVDEVGVPHDLTIRSFGILRAKDMPHVDVEIDSTVGEAVNGSDAVFAAVALAAWRQDGLATEWPTRRGGTA